MIEHNGYQLDLCWGQYENGRVAIQLMDKENGFPYARATINIPDAALGPQEVIIKNIDENAGILESLVDEGILRTTGKKVRVGWSTYEVCELLVEPQ